MRNKQGVLIGPILVAAVFLLSLAAITALLWPYFFRLSDPAFQIELAAWVKGAGWKGWLAAIGAQATQIFVAPIPGGATQALIGALYGPWVGFFFCLAGSLAGSYPAFWVGRKVGAPLVRQLLGEERMRQYSFMRDSKQIEIVTLVVFLLPGVPKDLMDYFAGITPIGMTRFVLISTAARMPGILASVLVGASAQSASWISLAVVVAVVLIIGAIALRYKTPIMAAMREYGKKK